MDDAAPDPQDAGHEADAGAGGDPGDLVEAIDVRGSAPVDEAVLDDAEADLACGRRRFRLGFAANDEEAGEEHEQRAEERVEDRVREVHAESRADRCAGERGDRELPGGAIVDELSARVGDRARERVQEDHRQRGADRLLRAHAVDEEEERNGDEAAAGADERPVRADGDAGEHQSRELSRAHRASSMRSAQSRFRAVIANRAALIARPLRGARKAGSAR